MIRLSLNGQPIEAQAQILLHDLVQAHTAEGSAFALAVNGEFVPKSQYHLRQLQDGDEIDLVIPVGGG
jgi:sulfur carrier protein